MIALSQADPEPAIGDYLVDGMANNLAKLHKRLKLAPFKPMHQGKSTQKERDAKGVIANMFFNRRHYDCKRIVLSEEFREIFSAKTQARLTFVPAGNEQLLNNERNDAMHHFVGLRTGTATRAVLVFPDEKPPPASGNAATTKENSSEQLGTVTADVVTDADLNALDGAEMPGDGGADVPPLPRGQGEVKGTRGAAASKKGGAASKKGGAAASKAARRKTTKAPAGAQALSGKRKKHVDSSDEDSSDEDSSGEDSSGEDSNEEAAPTKKRAGVVEPPAKKNNLTPTLKQTTLQPKLRLAELALGASEVTAAAVDPPLRLENAVGRFVFVPANQFGVQDISGWVGRIMKCVNDKNQTTTINFKDKDGRSSTEHFKFEHVQASFKPLS